MDRGEAERVQAAGGCTETRLIAIACRTTIPRPTRAADCPAPSSIPPQSVDRDATNAKREHPFAFRRRSLNGCGRCLQGCGKCIHECGTCLQGCGTSLKGCGRCLQTCGRCLQGC